jgi:HAD superfamily hydrolase (TIGR01549 family)
LPRPRKSGLVEAVVFDIGETLVDESRVFGLLAERAGRAPATFFAALGALIERRENHRSVFEVLDVESVDAVPYERDDLYDDVAECLRGLHDAGYRVGLAGNQPARTESFLHDCGLDADFVAASETWGVHKPAAAFFTRVADECGCPSERIAYVGDRVDNDVVPAADAGMVAVFLRRGPWGWLQWEWPEAARARIRIDSLLELPDALASLR